MKNKFMKGLCSYYKLREDDFDYLYRDLCDYKYPLSCRFLAWMIKNMFSILLNMIERYEDALSDLFY